MKYKLKANVENFDVVDGPFTGKKFRRGKVYRKEDIPENEMHRFEMVEDRSGVRGERLEAGPAEGKKTPSGTVLADAGKEEKKTKPKSSKP